MKFSSFFKIVIILIIFTCAALPSPVSADAADELGKYDINECLGGVNVSFWNGVNIDDMFTAAAAYQGETLVCVDTKPVRNGSNSFDFSFDTNSWNKAKVFFWNSETYKPLMKITEFDRSAQGVIEHIDYSESSVYLDYAFCNLQGIKCFLNGEEISFGDLKKGMVLTVENINGSFMAHACDKVVTGMGIWEDEYRMTIDGVDYVISENCTFIYRGFCDFKLNYKGEIVASDKNHAMYKTGVFLAYNGNPSGAMVRIFEEDNFVGEYRFNEACLLLEQENYYYDAYYASYNKPHYNYYYSSVEMFFDYIANENPILLYITNEQDEITEIIVPKSFFNTTLAKYNQITNSFLANNSYPLIMINDLTKVIVKDSSNKRYVFDSSILKHGHMYNMNAYYYGSTGFADIVTIDTPQFIEELPGLFLVSSVSDIKIDNVNYKRLFGSLNGVDSTFDVENYYYGFYFYPGDIVSFSVDMFDKSIVLSKHLANVFDLDEYSGLFIQDGTGCGLGWAYNLSGNYLYASHYYFYFPTEIYTISEDTVWLVFDCDDPSMRVGSKDDLQYYNKTQQVGDGLFVRADNYAAKEIIIIKNRF